MTRVTAGFAAASPTQAEMQDGLRESRDHFHNIMSSRAGPN